MGTNGIVRRIDELGRIVIPKEIRKSLNIKEGEMLEIIPDNNKVIVKKYSAINNIKNISNIIIKNISKLTSNMCVITDLNSVVDIGNNLDAFKLKVGDNISKDLYNVILSREGINSKNINLFDKVNTSNCFKVVIPIIDDTYVIGCIIILSLVDIKDKDINLAKFASYIISSSL